MLRQGMKVTPKELRKLADSLEKDIIETNKTLKLEMTKKEIENTKFQVNIINKQPKCSDTWRLE